jgi:hypothetical protein
VLQPLENAENFRLGKPEQLPAIGEGMVNWKGVKKMLLKAFTFGKHGSDEAPEKDEL